MIASLSRHRVSLIALCIATAASAFIFGRIDVGDPAFANWDLHQYRKMAEASPSLASEVEAPFAYRLLGPLLAGSLPGSSDTWFYALSLAASLGCVLALYFFMVAQGVGSIAATLAAGAYAFNKHLFGFSIWDSFQLNDALSNLFVLLSFGAMLAGRWWAFGSLVLLGAMTREPSMLLVPTACAYLLERAVSGERWRAFLLACLPALVAFAAIRALIEAPGTGLVEALQAHAPKLRNPETWLRLGVNAFIPLTLLPLVYYRKTYAFFRDKKYAIVFVALVLASTLFASNHERLMAPTFVVFYWLIAVLIDAEVGRHRMLLWILPIASVLASLHHVITRFDFMTKTSALTVALACMAALTLTAAWYELRERG